MNKKTKEELKSIEIDLSKSSDTIIFEALNNQEFLSTFKEDNFLLTNDELKKNYLYRQNFVLPLFLHGNCVGAIQGILSKTNEAKKVEYDDLMGLKADFDVILHQIKMECVGGKIARVVKKELEFKISDEHHKNILNFARMAKIEASAIIKRLRTLNLIKGSIEDIKTRKKYFELFLEKHKKIQSSLKYLHIQIESLKEYCDKQLQEVADDLSSRANIIIKPELLLSYEKYVAEYKVLANTAIYDDMININERVRHYRHQIKTMLSGISTLALKEELEEELESEEIELSNEYILNELSISIERAYRLLRQSQMIIGINKKKERFKASRLVTLKPVEQMLTRFQKNLSAYRYKMNTINIHFKYEIDTQYEDFFDIPKIEEILLILIENASEELGEKSMRTNESFKPIISLSIRIISKRFIIEIIDNGRGIAPDVKERIFDAYFTKGKTQGSGIGLSVVKEFAKRNGGIVEVFDNPYDKEGTMIRLETKIN